MKFFGKVINFLNALIICVASFIAMMCVANYECQVWFTNWFFNVALSSTYSRLWTILILWILFAMSIIAFASLIKKRQLAKGITKRNDLGECKISFTAIEDIANAEARRLTGLKVIKTPVVKTIDGVAIEIKANACMDENIPELSKAVQDRVKNAIEKSTDIKVSSVKVQISEVFVPNKPRVE